MTDFNKSDIIAAYTRRQAMNSDTVAYLSQAAIALAKAEGIDPGDRPRFDAWVSANMELITAKAMSLQITTLPKFFDYRADIQGEMCERVYSALQY